MFEADKIAVSILGDKKSDSKAEESGEDAGKHAFIAAMEAGRSGDWDTAYEAFEAAVAACMAKGDDPPSEY